MVSVPKSRTLMLDKAAFLAQEKRAAEAYELYRAVLIQDPADPIAATGMARMLSLLGHHGEASRTFDAVLARYGNDVETCNNAAEAALLAGDPQKSLALYQQSLRNSPHNQSALAGLSVGLRLMGDERDEALNGYETLIQVFDLEPPEGFSDMAAFNAALNAYLDSLHPETREYISQSLRGGTQTASTTFRRRPRSGAPPAGPHQPSGDWLYRRPEGRYEPPLPVAARRGLPLCGILVIAAEGLRFSYQPHPSQRLDQLLLLCRRARRGKGRNRAPGLDQIRRAAISMCR